MLSYSVFTEHPFLGSRLLRPVAAQRQGKGGFSALGNRGCVLKTFWKPSCFGCSPPWFPGLISATLWSVHPNRGHKYLWVEVQKPPAKCVLLYGNTQGVALLPTRGASRSGASGTVMCCCRHALSEVRLLCTARLSCLDLGVHPGASGSSSGSPRQMCWLGFPNWFLQYLILQSCPQGLHSEMLGWIDWWWLYTLRPGNTILRCLPEAAATIPTHG